MTAYAAFQDQELRAEQEAGYAACTHQRFVGTGYFDSLTETICGEDSEVVALKGSTEEEQFSK
jgi:isocitrate lyase